jgi:activating signal cointegrator 1
VKFLTIRQPWAQLIAVGAKHIETRPFSTKYRGPLAIHAGKAWPVPVGEWQVPSDRGPGPMIERLVSPLAGTYRWEAIRTPLGAVVAVCDLVDVVPIVEYGAGPEPPPHDREVWLPDADARANGDTLAVAEWEYDGWGWPVDIDDQLPFGDFTPGRFAWLLDNVRPIDPVPMKGAQGLRDLPADVAEAITRALTEGEGE